MVMLPLEVQHFLRAEHQRDVLARVGRNLGGTFQRPLEHRHDAIRCEEADRHPDERRDGDFDDDPAEVFEMFEEGFYRAAFAGLVVEERVDRVLPAARA